MRSLPRFLIGALVYLVEAVRRLLASPPLEGLQALEQSRRSSALSDEALPAVESLRLSGISSVRAWGRAEELARPALILASTVEDERFVWGLVDLTCALLSAGSDAKALPGIRRTYAEAFQRMPAEVPALSSLERACVQRAIQDCCCQLSVRPYRTAELQASAARFCADSATAREVLGDLCPLLVACALSLDPTPSLRRLPPTPKRYLSI